MANGDIEQVENSKNHSNWGGAREGAGRPVGSENEETKLRRLTEQQMKDRIVRSTDALLNSQMALAYGEVNLYHIYYEGEGKNRKKVVDIVTDQKTITDYLADELDEGTDEDYYYIATKSPDNKAIDSLLDRTYGKAKQSIDANMSVQFERPIMGGSSVSRNDSLPEDSQS